MKDLGNEMLVGQSLVPATRTASANGSAVDMSNSGAEFTVNVDVGAVTGTNPTLDVKVQESADGSTGWTDVAGATMTQKTAAGIEKKSFYNRSMRYLRAVATIAGTTPSFPCAVSIESRKLIM